MKKISYCAWVKVGSNDSKRRVVAASSVGWVAVSRGSVEDHFVTQAAIPSPPMYVFLWSGLGREDI